jgi:cysteine desulfurase
MRRVYLDHNARAPLHPDAQHAMSQGMALLGNPSSAHAEGQAARAAVEHARTQVATLLNTVERTVTFTSGATESLHAALHGALAATHKKTVVTLATEHHAVLDELARLQAAGSIKATVVGVNSDGTVDEDRWRAALNDDVAVAMVMWANNETGVLHNVRKLLKRAREDAGAFTILDGAQVPGRLNIDVGSMAADAMAISACKFGGPPGVGALWINPSAEKAWKPTRAGGSQERGKRPGTENLLGVLGMGAAAAVLAGPHPHPPPPPLQPPPPGEGGSKALETALKAAFPNVIIHGETAERLPNTTFAAFPGVDAQTLLMLLDQAGVAASSGSACVSGSMKPSHVLLAMGVPPALAKASVRFSVGRSISVDDVDFTITALRDAIPKSRMRHA